ncbi:unnamed protein product, partial [Dibothriocephalus latus]
EKGVNSAQLEANLLRQEPDIAVNFLLLFTPPVTLSDFGVTVELHSTVHVGAVRSRIRDLRLTLGEGFVPLAETDHYSVPSNEQKANIHYGPIYNTGSIYQQDGVIPRAADQLTIHLSVAVETGTLVTVNINLGSRQLQRQFRLETSGDATLQVVPVFTSSLRWPNQPHGKLATG